MTRFDGPCTGESSTNAPRSFGHGSPVVLRILVRIAQFDMATRILSLEF
jgi:hypothetical protein